ncbi:DUF523 and DUF1722 domain-containing protein [Candidatus Bipolaricaulota bacterium]|nr:DUF523 and DUF1722 domain-containing protein [Candidatus Bipolaricaulota bacterium]
MARTFAKPIVFFSHCLGFEACRYNGAIIHEPALEQIKPFLSIESACPEMAIGLGVPRSPLRLVETDQGVRLVQPETDRDVTDAMISFSRRLLDELRPVDGVVFKWGSPSCGPREVRRYSSPKRGASFTKGQGLFAQLLSVAQPSVPIEDEGRLKNFEIREHFLTRLFAGSALRLVGEAGDLSSLVAFHAEHKLLLMAYNQQKMRELGRIVASARKAGFKDAFDRYRQLFMEALSRTPRQAANINVLMHALGYFSDQLSPNEKGFFLDTLEAYRNRRVCLSAATRVMQSWIVRFQEPYLASQAYFEPFPAALVDTLDSGKGRAL